MAAYYLDTSALVKCYVRESGTDWMRTLVQSRPLQFFATVRLAGPELVAALFRKVRTGELLRGIVHQMAQDFKSDWQARYNIIKTNYT